MVNLFLGNEVEGGPANIFLRRLGSSVAASPLIGPLSPGIAEFANGTVRTSGSWQGVRFSVSLILGQSTPAWFWHVTLENLDAAPITLDLIHVQDLALAHYGAVRLNEYYVSQYLDHTPLAHPHLGWLLATRQNLSMGGRNPWCLIGALSRSTAYATDALQVLGLSRRAGHSPLAVTEGLPSVRRQHEHAMAALQTGPIVLQPGERTRTGFFGWFEADQPVASSSADLSVAGRALALPEATLPPPDGIASPRQAQDSCLFANTPLLEAMELTEEDLHGLFGGERREPELDENGRLLSFFRGFHRHVVLRAKELEVLRPHGHILRTGNRLTPDEAALTSTVWMAGVFHSMVTQGHVSINRFLSTCHGYLSLFRSYGQRVFVELDGEWRLLDVPSAFEMGLDACRWIYKHPGGLIEVMSRAGTDRHELSLAVSVVAGPKTRLLISNHIALNGDNGSGTMPALWEANSGGMLVRPIPDSDVGRRFPDGGFRLDPRPAAAIERAGGDELLFADGESRGQPFVCVLTAPIEKFELQMTGRLVASEKLDAQSPEDYWRRMAADLEMATGGTAQNDGSAARLGEIFPWFVHNALIHLLSPRGLEQYSGGGWGTRDVTQGPVECLLALTQFEPVRDLLIRVFRTQNADGDWPQWFMFFERERNIRPSESHGDIVFWPLLALAQYLLASGDAGLLDEVLPFFHPEGDSRAERGSVWEHVQRALRVIETRTIPGTQLAAYGHGDWNDSLQPADPGMRDRLCSAWTVTLHYQTLTTQAAALRKLGRNGPAEEFEATARQVLADFQRLLVVDDTTTGLAYFRENGSVDYLMHPRDRTTGLSYSLLPMMHAIINGMFDQGQAERHLALIGQHLLGPDGARLFDKPIAYSGGPQKNFQRAESSSFFGREIGLMYMHAHLRYAEALWRCGKAERFLDALNRVNPIALRTFVPSATRRQANCYYSSSDAGFNDRYQASERYAEALSGNVPLDGGWRVYSSGAGIGVALIIRCLLGFSWPFDGLTLDPVLPRRLDGLKTGLTLRGVRFEIEYRIGDQGFGPLEISLNGAALPYIRLSNAYRLAGAKVANPALEAHLVAGINSLLIVLS